MCASGTLIASYGETITIPCNNGAPPPQDLIFIKWKYVSNSHFALNEVLRVLYTLTLWIMFQWAVKEKKKKCVQKLMRSSNRLLLNPIVLLLFFFFNVLPLTYVCILLGKGRWHPRRSVDQTSQRWKGNHSCHRRLCPAHQRWWQLQPADRSGLAQRHQDLHLHGGVWGQPHGVPCLCRGSK